MDKSSEKLMMNKVRETPWIQEKQINRGVQPGQVVFISNKVVQPNKKN